VETPKWGRIKIDVAFGGVYYALVDVEQFGFDIAPANARLLAEAGIELKLLLSGQVSVAHPVLSGIDEIAYVIEGTFTFQRAGEQPKTMKQGEADLKRMKDERPRTND